MVAVGGPAGSQHTPDRLLPGCPNRAGGLGVYNFWVLRIGVLVDFENEVNISYRVGIPSTRPTHSVPSSEDIETQAI